jgi:hypothetical protein
MDHSDKNPSVMTVKTLRDEFAMAAMNGMLSNNTLVRALMKEKGVTYIGQFLEENAYCYADGLIRARDRRE